MQDRLRQRLTARADELRSAITAGPAFLGALDVRTGEALVQVSLGGMKRPESVKLFTTTAWTVPTLVGTTLYARDRERIVALALGAP